MKTNSNMQHRGFLYATAGWKIKDVLKWVGDAFVNPLLCCLSPYGLLASGKHTWTWSVPAACNHHFFLFWARRNTSSLLPSVKHHQCKKWSGASSQLGSAHSKRTWHTAHGWTPTCLGSEFLDLTLVWIFFWPNWTHKCWYHVQYQQGSTIHFFAS